MERVIPVTIRDKIAKAPKDKYYVCGNTDYVIQFDFDADWAAYNTKTARFKHNGTHQDVIFDGDECRVPKITDTYSFEVGVFAGDLRTTTAAYIPCKKSILCGSRSPSPPAPDVYAQIMQKLNTMEGGDVSPEEIAAAVEAYMKEHPNYGGGIDEEQLDKAVQAALKEAKESGEFDGPPGKDGEKGDKGDPGDDYILTDADKQEIAGMIPGGEDAIVEDLFYVKLEEPVTEIIAKLTRRANHMFVLVYRPDEYEDAFYVYVYATDLQTIETTVSSETQITDGVRLEAGAAVPAYVNRFLCKLDFQGGLLSAYWGISPEEYQTKEWSFLNKPIKCTYPDGINRIILRNYVGDKLFPKGTAVRIVGA